MLLTPDVPSFPESTHFLLYRSHATQGLRPEDLGWLLEHAQAYNQPAGITGLLCYSEGLFVQLLEGSAEALAGVYAKIQRDPRHYGVTLLRTGTAAQRCFAQWSMAFTEASPVEYYWLIHQLQTRPGPRAAPQLLITNPLLLLLLTAYD